MKKLVVLFFLLFFGMAAFAQDYSTFKLSDGQTVIIKEVHDNPIVVIDTWLATGSINENDSNTGVSHFLEHLFFKGTSRFPSGEFDRVLESKGAVTNAATSKDFTHYYIMIPSKDFDLAMDLHSDMLLNPMIPRKEMEKERKVVLEEISKDKDNPSNILYENLNKLLYKNHPYKREVIGKKEVIETITREEVLDYYNKWYVPSAMTTVIIGDVDTQKALQAVQRNFKPKPSQVLQKQIKCAYPRDKKLESQVEVKQPFSVDMDYMLIGFKGCSAAERKDSYALDLLSTILGDGKTSRLYHNIKEQKQLVYSISAGHSSFKDDSVFYISANYSPENRESVKKAIFSEVDKLRRLEVDDEELQKAKSIIERDTYYSRESIQNIANEIGYTMVLMGDPGYYANYVANIKKVTAREIREVAQKYLGYNSAAISIVEPENAPKCSKTEKPTKTYSAKLISQNKNISKYLLPNNATLLINKNDVNDIISMQILSKGGAYTEKTPGLGSVTADAMMKGTKKYQNQELSQLLEENGIIISPQQKADMFSVDVKYTKNESSLALDLLNEVINNAILASNDVEKIKTDKLNAIKKNRDNPSNLAFEEFRTALWVNTAYGNTGKVLEKTIPTIKTEDTVDFYNRVFDPQNIVISINGNVDTQSMINYFSELFSCKKQGEKVVLTNYAKQFVPPNSNKIVKTSKETGTAWVILGWMTNGVLDKKDWATLQVIDAILGSGMSSRLFVDLRDQQGLAYQVGSGYSANVNKGAFALYIGTNPKTAILSRDEMFKEIVKLKKEFVSDKELSQAKDKILGNYVLSLETNMDKASAAGWMELSGRGYEFLDEYAGLINAVTVQDIITVSNKYFNAPYVMSVVGPKEIVDKF